MINFIDIGINDFPVLHTINIGYGILQIVPWDVMIDLKMVFIIVVFGSVFMYNFIKGYRGE